MKRKNKIPVVFLTSIMILSLIFSSCAKDDMMVTPEETVTLDSVSHYDWRIEPVFGQFFRDIYIADTSSIYIASLPDVLHYNGSTFETVNLGFQFNSRAIGSYDGVDIYIGGRYPTSPTYNRALILKYNSGNADVFEIPYDSTVSINNFLFEGPVKFWFTSSEGGDIYYFDNGTFKRYKLSLNSIHGIFYRDPSGSIYVFSNRVGPSGFEHILDCFKYNSALDSFVYVFAEPTYLEGTDVGDNLSVCGNDFISAGSRSFSYFTGTGWQKYIDTRFPNSKDYISPSFFVGYNRDSLLVYDDNGYNHFGKHGIYSYSPGKWNLEKWLSFYTFGTPLYVRGFKLFKDRPYAIFNNLQTPNTAFLVIGRMKGKLKIFFKNITH